MPQISVVMPARNAQATLMPTLQSLAAQTFKDFELVLVDDASTDATRALVDSMADQLNIQVVSRAVNQGVARSINDGIAASKGEFVARLDADDLAAPERLARQLAYMAEHPDVDVCGSHMEVFSEEDGQRRSHFVLAHPTTDASIKTALVQRSVLSHPSVIVRRRFFERAGLYDPTYDFAEDYELWTRGALLGCRYANLPEPLTMYRKHAAQVSQQKVQTQFERDLAIKRKYLSGLLDGEPTAYLAEWLSLQTQLSSKEVAVSVLAESSRALTLLARRVGDPDELARILSGCARRHLAA